MSTMPSVGSSTYAPGPNMVCSPQQEKVGTGSIEASTCPVYIGLRIRATVSNTLKHYYAKLSLFQQFQTLCTRMRQRLQQTRFAFLLPPKARTKGRLLSASRQAEWGLQTLAYLEAKEREASLDVSALAQALRGLKSFTLFLMTFVRNTTCLNQVMQMVKTHGLRAESIQACQETLGDLPVRSPIRKEVSHSLQRYVPVVESSDTPLLGSSDVIESLIGKAKQRL